MKFNRPPTDHSDCLTAMGPWSVWASAPVADRMYAGTMYAGTMYAGTMYAGTTPRDYRMNAGAAPASVCNAAASYAALQLFSIR